MQRYEIKPNKSQQVNKWTHFLHLVLLRNTTLRIVNNGGIEPWKRIPYCLTSTSCQVFESFSVFLTALHPYVIVPNLKSKWLHISYFWTCYSLLDSNSMLSSRKQPLASIICPEDTCLHLLFLSLVPFLWNIMWNLSGTQCRTLQ